MTENSVAMSYEELKCYHLLETVPRLDDGSEVFQPTLKEFELYRLLRALSVVDAKAASPGGQLGHFIDACLNGVKEKPTCGDGVANADAASPEGQLGDAVLYDAKVPSARSDAVADADAVLSEGHDADAGLNTGTEPKKDEKVDADASLNTGTEPKEDEKVDADQSSNVATFNRSIDVVACYGKQAAVEADLRAQGWWPTKLETYLHADHEGVYAILLPETTDRPKLVLFTWLLDASFSPKYLRERATYALRFLTTLTPTVRCCLGDAEWDALELAAAETRAESSQKNTAVELTITEAKVQEEHVSCEVASKPTKATPGDTLVAATGVTGVTMHVSQDHYIRTTSEWISIAPPADFAAWLLEAAKAHRIKYQVQLPSDCKRAVLEAMNLLPTEKLSGTTMESLDANLRDEAEAEATTMLAAIKTKVIEAGATLFFVHDNVTAAEEASAHKTLQEQKTALQNTLSPAIKLPPTFDPLVAAVINAEYARLLVNDTEFLALAEKSLPWYRSGPSASLKFPLLKKHKPEMDLILPRTQGVLHNSYEAWSQVVRAFLESDQVVNITTDQCYNKLVAKAKCQETQRREKEAMIVHEAFVAATEAANAKHAPTELCVNIDSVYERDVHIQKAIRANGATVLTLTPVGGAPLGSIKLPRDAVVVHVAYVAGPRTVVVVVFTWDGKTHVQSHQANGARPTTRLVTKFFPTTIKRCDFDASQRLLALQHSDTKVEIFAFSESFKVFTRVHQFNLQLLGPTAPYTTMHLFGGANHGLFVVGDDGSAQSYYLRTQQQSKLVPDFATPGSKVVKLQNGAFMVRIEPLGNEDNDEHPRRLRLHTLEIQSHVMLPLVAEVALPKALKFFHWSTVQARAYDDTIVLLDQSSGTMLVLKMTVVTGKVGLEVTCAHSAAPVTASESHVLAPLFHVFEKFPVRAFMTRGDDDDDDSDDSEDEDAAKSKPNAKCDDVDLLPMALQLHVQASSPKRRKAAARVLKAIMKKLKKLNKRLASLSLAKDTVMNGDVVWPTMALGRWVLEVVGFVPVPICRARDNELELLRDGNVVTLSECAEVHEMVPNIIFGPTSYILKAWCGPIVVITSMGKQSTGKSYFLNHLTGSSFAISGARCTDGVWLTLRPYGETLLVVLDFEGLGSFERSMQEDTLLSVLNAAISQLTIFRIEMRFDKDIDAMFAKFQQGVTMLKGDPRLFSGRLYMNAKDVNPNDTDTLVGEFRSKLAGLLKNATADNFLTVMYSGRVLVTACAPLNNVGYYHGLAQASTCLAEARDRKTFSSGADFHECLAYLLAKIARRDWTSMDDNIRAGKTAWLREQLRYALRNGKLDAAITATSVDIWADDDDAMVAKRQAIGLADMVVPRDAEIEFGLELDGPTDAAANLSVVKATLLHYLGRYLQLVASHDEDHLAKAPRRGDHEATFDVLWKYIVWRREHRVRAWFESLGGSSRQALQDDFNKCVQDVKQLLRRCEHNCSTCKLGCFASFLHDRDVPHDCGGSHRCEGRCAHCDDDAPCGVPAGHAGSCNCRKKSHTCPQVCHLAAARNCNGNCHLDVDHVGPHVCSVKQHLCPEACEAESCRNECYHPQGVTHATHSCGTRRCQQRCSYVGCTGTCASDDHFHAVGALHSCGQEHTCQAKCTAGGNCGTKITQETFRTTFFHDKDATEYSHQVECGLQNKCAIKFQAGCIDHKGKDHRCDVKEHTCDVRCPCCDYYCTKPHRHTDPHATTHGSMIETTFVMDIAVLELETDRKYAAGDRGVAEMCPFFCSKLGRGHVHYMPCEHASADACTSAAKDGRRHSTMKLASNPTQAMDEVLHDTYWKTLGWEDPVSSALERTKFASCPYECESPEHKDAGSDKSYCVLGAWHEPVVDATTLKSGQFLVQGHVFKCRHIAAKGLQHHVFVLDASWSMSGESWQALTAAFHAYVAQILATRSQNCADIVSVVTFANAARIVHEAQPLIKMAKISLPFSSGGTSYDAGLRCANEVLSRNDHKTYSPVMLFLSDGEPDSNATGVALAQDIAKSYSIYNLQSSFVGFGNTNFARLEILATHLNGKFLKAVTGADLLATFEEISVPEHIRAGLLGKATTTGPTKAA